MEGLVERMLEGLIVGTNISAIDGYFVSCINGDDEASNVGINDELIDGECDDNDDGAYAGVDNGSNE